MHWVVYSVTTHEIFFDGTADDCWQWNQVNGDDDTAICPYTHYQNLFD